MRGSLVAPTLILGAALAMTAPRTAGADAAADAAAAAKLVAEGEELARKLEWSRAIERFKRADALVQRARHACLIGLAYQRRELFSQAEIFLALCHDRASLADPAPAWLAETERELDYKLATLDVAAVEITVIPADVAADATLTVSSFAPDERFRPRTIHLPRGSHVITAAVAGYPDRSETVTIAGKDKVAITIDVTVKEVGPRPSVRRAPPSPASKWLLISAGGLAAAGGVLHFLAYQKRNDLIDASDAGDEVAYDDAVGAFDTLRIATFSAYGLAAVAAGVGLYLRLNRPMVETAPAGPSVTGALGPGGAMVLVEWRR